MRLTKKQREHIKELLPYFEKLPKGAVNQKFGEACVKRFAERVTECGFCFGVHLAKFYGIESEAPIARESNCKGFVYDYMDGKNEFLKRMDIESWKWGSDSDLFRFMKKCGTGLYEPFGELDWDEPVVNVLRNMLKKGGHDA